MIIARVLKALTKCGTSLFLGLCLTGFRFNVLFKAPGICFNPGSRKAPISTNKIAVVHNIFRDWNILIYKAKQFSLYFRIFS